MSGWRKLEDVLSQDEVEKWKQRIDLEFSDPVFQNKVFDAMACHKEPCADSGALIVLGPSASGKTHALCLAGVDQPGFAPDQVAIRSQSSRAFSTNMADMYMPENAVVLDGSIVRDCSSAWNEAVALAHSKNFDGFSNLFDEYFKPSINKLKGRVTERVIESRWNLIVPDTASNFKKTASLIKRLIENGYSVRIMAIYAESETCQKRGKSREKYEGKKYSNKNWATSVQSIIDAENLLVELGLTDKVAIFSNDDGSCPSQSMSTQDISTILSERQRDSTSNGGLQQESLKPKSSGCFGSTCSSHDGCRIL